MALDPALRAVRVFRVERPGGTVGPFTACYSLRDHADRENLPTPWKRGEPWEDLAGPPPGTHRCGVLSLAALREWFVPTDDDLRRDVLWELSSKGFQVVEYAVHPTRVLFGARQVTFRTRPRFFGSARLARWKRALSRRGGRPSLRGPGTWLGWGLRRLSTAPVETLFSGRP